MLIYAKYSYSNCCGCNKERTLISEPSRECTVPATVRRSPARQWDAVSRAPGIGCQHLVLVLQGRAFKSGYRLVFCPQPYEILTLLRLVRA